MFDVVNARCRGVCVRHGPKIVDAATRCLRSSQKPGVAVSMLRHGPKIVDAVTRCLCSS